MIKDYITPEDRLNDIVYLNADFWKAVRRFGAITLIVLLLCL